MCDWWGPTTGISTYQQNKVVFFIFVDFYSQATTDMKLV